MTRIINAHVHLIELEALARTGDGPLIPGGIAVYENLDKIVSIFSPETLIAQMDEAGIEKSILFAVNAPILYSSNEYVKEICDEFPNRFIGFASVDPLAPDSLEVLEYAIKDFKGDVADTIEAKESFILDGTAASVNQTIQLKSELEEAGYEVFMLYVYTDLERSLRQNQDRFEKSGGEDRSLSPAIVLRAWLSVTKNWTSYKDMFLRS